MADQPAADENKLIAERRAKLAELRERGNPFPNDFRRTALAGELHAEFEQESKEALAEAGT
jgi:lysyl-tRNA synthetase class 2